MRHSLDRWLRLLVLPLLLFGLLLSPHPGAAQGGAPTVYADALGAGWQNWSWDSTVNFATPSPVYSGSASVAVTYTAAWGGLYLHTYTLIDSAGYDTLRFWVHGGAQGGQGVEVKLADGTQTLGQGVAVSIAANTWTKVDVPLSRLGSPAQISGVAWQDTTGHGQATFYLDQIAFVNSGFTPTPTPPPGAGPALNVDASAARHAISPDIYGMNYASEELANAVRLPVRRWGGNSTTRYNYLADTSNTANDWYFENIPEDNANPAALPDGSTADRFIDQDRRTETRTIITVPLMGWTPKARAYACGFSVAKYGAQQRTDPYRPDCGNGIRPDGSKVTGNDAADTSQAIDPTFVQGWLNHLITRYGTAANGGVAFYNLDNEPMLWNDTHRDVHPTPTSYDELRDRTFAYAAAIKATDPSARTLGPVLWGWTAYFYSALDWAPGGNWWNNPQDRNAHGGVPFAPWYLSQMKAYEQQYGVRLVDYLDLHYYTQASGVALAPATDAANQALRLRSTRSLWDTTYVDESWINEPVYLIPRMRDWVAQNYPGTKLAITEYNWGALDNINGALAQADVLGIFGREGLDLATLWSPPAATDPGAFAFRMYRNVDGAGSGFGDVSVRAASADQGQLAVYAAQRTADGALTLMVINKTANNLTSAVSLAGVTPAGAAQVYRYSAANLAAIVRQADQPVTAGGFIATFPANSITLLVVPTGASAPPATPMPTATRAVVATSTPTPTATRTPAASVTPTPTSTIYLPLIHVGDLDGVSTATSSSRWKASVTIAVHDARHNPIANAAVSGAWSAGTSGSGSCVTGPTGRCAIAKTGLSRSSVSRVTFSVTNVTATGMTYQASANHDSDGDSTGTALTVFRP